jgi:hypothetical protein
VLEHLGGQAVLRRLGRPAVLQRHVQEMPRDVWLLLVPPIKNNRHDSPGVRWANPGAGDLQEALFHQLEPNWHG